MNTLLKEYVHLAHRWGIAMKKGASSLANSIHDEIHELHKKIEVTGAVEIITQCSVDESDSVRFWAASYLKGTDNKQAITIYETLTNSSLPFVSLPSQYILQQLKKSKEKKRASE